MVRASVFEQCGGLQALLAADVDLCLTVAAAGSLVVLAPQAQLAIEVPAAPVPEAGQQLLAKWPGAFTREVAIDGQWVRAEAAWLVPFK